MAQTVRITPEAHADLVEIAREKRIPLTEALTEALRAYRKELFLQGVAADFAAMSSDELAKELAEAGKWDATLADGMTDE